MDSFNIDNENSPFKSEYQRTNNNSRTSRKKEQIISERVGNYRYIYLINEKGQKILLTKVLAYKFEEERAKERQMQSVETEPASNCTKDNFRTAFEYNQQVRLQVVHKQNMQDIMDIIKDAAGISNQDE